MTDHIATEQAAGGDFAQASAQAPAVYERPQAPAPVAAQSESAAMVAMIERMASDPSIDLDRVKAVLALRREMKEEAAREAFNIAMAACKAEIPQVIKNGKNADNNSKYATLDQIGAAVDKIVAKHGFSTSFHPAPCDREGFLKVVCLVGHTGGHERIFAAELPTDAAGLKGGVNKTPIHAWKSTMTYGRRVLTEMIFDVKSTSDDDGNAAGGKVPPPVITEDQAQIIRELVKKTGSNLDALLAVYKADSIPDILAADYERLNKQLEKKLAAKAKEVFAS